MKWFRHLWQGSLFTQLITRISIILFVLAILIQTASLALFRNIYKTTLTERAVQMLSQVNNSISMFNKQLVYMIGQIDLNHSIQSYLTTPSEDQFLRYKMIREMNTYLTTFSTLFDAYKIQIVILGVNNMVYASSDTLRLAFDPKEILQFPLSVEAFKSREKMVYSLSHPSILQGITDSSVMLIAKTLYNKYTGKTSGILFVSIGEDTYYKLYRELADKNTRFAIIDSQGYIVSDSERENIGKQDINLLQHTQAIKQTPNANQTVTINGSEYLLLADPLSFADGWLIELVNYDTVIQRSNDIWGTLLILTVGFISITCCISFFYIKRITKPIQRLSDAMLCFMQGKTPERVKLSGCTEIEIAGNAFNQMLDDIDAYIQKLDAEYKARRQAEIHSLQMQITPHFLYNTLACIKYFAFYGRNKEIAEAITALTLLLRKAMSETDEIIPLKRELELINHYMVIQKLRYGDQISLRVVVDESLLNCQVPKLILQPLVENSIVHGFKGTVPHGVISIFARETNTMDKPELIIEVIDNGIGMSEDVAKSILSVNTEDQQEHYGIGLKNVNNRIKIIYGDKYGLAIFSEFGVGTQVTIRIPSVHAQTSE